MLETEARLCAEVVGLLWCESGCVGNGEDGLGAVVVCGVGL